MTNDDRGPTRTAGFERGRDRGAKAAGKRGFRARGAWLLVAALALGGLAIAAPSAHATDRNIECAGAKQRAALKRLLAINACYRKGAQLGNQQQQTACIQNAKDRFERDFQRIEAVGGCVPATGDGPVVADLVDECGIDLAIVLPGICLPAGESCGGGSPPCCTGLTCQGQIGHPAVCG